MKGSRDFSFREQLKRITQNDGLHLTGVLGHRDLCDEDQSRLREEIHWYLRTHAARYRSAWPGTCLVGGLSPVLDGLVDELSANFSTIRQVTVYPSGVTTQGGTVGRKGDPVFTLKEETWKSPTKPPAAGHHPVPSLPSAGQQPTDEERLQQFRWMADTCDVLLVLWDGNHCGEKSSVSDTIAYAMSEACTSARRASGLGALIIHHLVVPRTSNPFPMGEAFTWRRYESPRTRRSEKYRIFQVLGDRVVQAWISFVLGLSAVSLGCWGFMSQQMTKDVPKAGFWEAFFDAIGFLTLNNLNLPACANQGLLFWSRFFAVLFVAFTSLFIVAHLVIDRFIVWRAVRRIPKGRSHAIVCGAGWQGKRVIEELVYKSKTRVVVVEQKHDEVFDVWCRTHGVGLVLGDACDPHLLMKAGIADAASIYVFCNNDDVTIRIVSSASSRCHKECQAIVSLESKRMFGVLQAALERPAMLDAQMLNVDSTTVQMLLERYPFDRISASAARGQGNPRVLIIGESSIAREILRQVIQMAHFEHDANDELVTIEVSIAVPRPMAFAAGFVKHYPAYHLQGSVLEPVDPWAKAEGILPSIRVLELPDSERMLTESGTAVEQFVKGGAGASTVFVAIDEGHKSTSVARALANCRQMNVPDGENDLTLLVYVNEKDNAYRQRVSHNLNADVPRLPIIVFGDFVGEASPTSLAEIPTERLARYINAWHSLGGKMGDETAIKRAWSALREDHKDSSRQAAAHVAVKLRVRSRLVAQGRASEVTAQLAQIEHRRWCAEKLLKGYVPWEPLASVEPRSAEHEKLFDEWYRDRKKLQAAFRHFDLVPFHQLLPKEQQKDIGQIHYVLDDYIQNLVPAWNRRFLPDDPTL